MGMYDTVRVECPKCGADVGFQSKAGDCYLREYRQDNVPSEIALDIAKDSNWCQNCGTQVMVEPKLRSFVEVIPYIVGD